jgi:hypothetical protein
MATMQVQASPHRREARFRIAADALITDAQTGFKLNAKVENISRSGCYVNTPNPLMQWTRVRVWVVYRCQQFEATGAVVHCQGGRGMGVEFDKVAARDLDLLEAWLRELTV